MTNDSDIKPGVESSLADVVSLPSGKKLWVEVYETGSVSMSVSKFSASNALPRPPILFIHGLLGNTRNFHPIVRSPTSSLRDRVLVTFDLRGHGRSPVHRDRPDEGREVRVEHGEGQLTMQDLASDAREVLDYVFAARKSTHPDMEVDIVAHSAGTLIALQLALSLANGAKERPGSQEVGLRIRKLVLLGPPMTLVPTTSPSSSSSSPPTKLNANDGKSSYSPSPARQARARGRAALIREKGIGALAPPGMEDEPVPEGDAGSVADLLDAMAGVVFGEDEVAGTFRRSSTVTESKINMNLEDDGEKGALGVEETIIVVGEKDHMVDEDAAESIARMAGGRVVRMGCGHEFMEEDAEGVVRMLVGVLKADGDSS